MLEAISALTTLTTLALRAAESAQRVSALIAAAQAEGRDLTEAEVSAICALRDTAMQRWDNRGKP